MKKLLVILAATLLYSYSQAQDVRIKYLWDIENNRYGAVKIIYGEPNVVTVIIKEKNKELKRVSCRNGAYIKLPQSKKRLIIEVFDGEKKLETEEFEFAQHYPRGVLRQRDFFI